MGKETKHFYEFGPFQIDPDRQLLLRAGEPVPLTAKAFETLLVLVQHSEQLVSKDELMKLLWPDTFVEESNLTQHISMLRKALGESPQDHRYIVTMPGRGYRFAERVKEIPEGGEDLVVESHSIQRVTIDTEEGLSSVPPLLPKTRRIGSIVWLLGILVVAGAAGYFSWQHFHPNRQGGRIMLAVLPFENLTGDPEQEYISDGLTEEMITRLGGLNPERLGVIARTSVMGYKHSTASLDQIGRELGVQYVLEGSLRRAPDRLRITAQLIRVQDQSHLWAQDYDRSIKDVLAVQDEVAIAVADRTQLALTPTARTAMAHVRTTKPEALDPYFRGRYALNQRTADGDKKAVAYFQQAIEKDPGYALAHAGLADAYVVLASLGVSPEESILHARSAAKTALGIDPALAEAHTTLALVAQNHDWDWLESEREFKLAMASNPNYATAHHWYAAGLSVRGRFEEAFRELRLARELDPFSLVIRASEGEFFYIARQYDQAIESLSQTLEMEPNFPAAYLSRGLAYEQKGNWKEALADLETTRRLDDTSRNVSMLAEAYALAGEKEHARKLLHELRDRAKREYVSSLYPALIYAGLGENDLAFAGLEKAIQERTTDLLGLKVVPIYDPLRSDPRFPGLLRRVGLTP